ncbi:nuclear transport factor 2 family protein [Actinoplanes sp. LDG1-06]|uniref:Nuclear transport factor 2 family protein n=1 Tax=Paractinoplanes ovalisporus TaxID=2810368 RepID=A0ABS2ABG5_9ACTN|nr:nuclear transport factor 2 family protein [Actinoplanes ovalisporus]MBM2617156.1 nuclear transport factor 2 family protein [Actinoplanes ovalisporus]
MSETDDFLAEVMPRLRAAEIALHAGDPGPRGVLWSHEDPVSLFGAEINRVGWGELEPAFAWLASRFGECQALDYEIVAVDARGDLAYLVAIERVTALVNGEPVSYALRATTVFRREAGAWRVVHRHGDRYEQH